MNLKILSAGWLWYGVLPPILLLPVLATAQVRIVREQETQRLFAGEARLVALTLCNPGANEANLDLHTRLYQASSATAVLEAEAHWKKLQVLPGQTVLESAALTFPAVKAETRFVVQWVEGTNRVIGTTEVLAYPPDLLKGLKLLAGEEPLGVFDPQNQLKPLLKAVAVEFQDLEDTGIADYHGPLAVIGPFQSRQQMRESLENRSVKALAQKGAAIVWIQPPPEQLEQPKPSYYTVPQGTATVVVVQAELVANLAERPQAQLNLIRFARLALRPEPLGLPNLTLKQ